MFKRKSKGSPEAEAMRALRSQALAADATALGIEPSERCRHVFGVVMDTAYDNGIATLVAFADGTTSLYTSAGFGIIGGGAHERVVEATRALLRAAEDHRQAFSPDPSDAPPAAGAVTVRLLTFSGRLATTVDEAALIEGRSALSPIYYAADAVITELRSLDGIG